ncbi:LL-diaminopimelate aminotransferase [Lyngbya confervoides]|uniref:LL-diaminopimelate aminotransferase n=1 Tax=Lyngbya confervoides BDU141951 TaxID=1574623 RepID=A0ABD4SZ09_9CYAN|nr:LL-diaminopimelate aminotransferase [Lyngbya confervoides]MCM1981375.1 LL-diaminopimelate aminotransferase [Lyngbya confervoides BDU141951]
MQLAERLKPLRRNVFADMDEAKALARAQGKDLIDLSLGSSDLAASDAIVDEISRSLQDKSTHGYLLFQGTRDFRETVAQWYQQRYGLSVDPETEVLPLIGSQEGTAHLPLAILNPGDYALLLDPGYPSHAGGVYLANGRLYGMPLRLENHFLPDFSTIPPDILGKARLMILSYPHNPTTATASLEFFQRAVQFCQEHHLVLAHDFPYADLVFSHQPAPSILQADRDRTCSIEFFTLSKSYSMGGFRIGYAIGNPDLIAALRRIKAVVDFNQYRGILNGAQVALQQGQSAVEPIVQCFRQRQIYFLKALAQMGWMVRPPAATMYIWAALPPEWSHNSLGFSQALVAQTGVAVSPGAGFGAHGEGYIRFALVHDEAILGQAVDRIRTFLHT